MVRNRGWRRRMAGGITSLGVAAVLVGCSGNTGTSVRRASQRGAACACPDCACARVAGGAATCGANCKCANCACGKTAAAPVNARCPLTGEPVNPAVTVRFDGKTVGFCCKACIEPWNKLTAADKAKKLVDAS